MGRSTVHYADNDTNNILKRLHNKLRPAGTPVERVEYIIELLLLRIFEAKLKQDDLFKILRNLFEEENYRLLFSHLLSLTGDQVLIHLNKELFPFYASILTKASRVIKGNIPFKLQDHLILLEEVFANSNFTNNVKGGVIAEVIGLVQEIDEKLILKTDLLGDAIESALSETGGTKDLGLFRTPGHIRKMMVEMVDPDFSDSIFDPACGTGGFLFDAYDYVIKKARLTRKFPAEHVANQFYRTGISGVEYQGRIRKMAAVNMYIRGLNPHNIEQGDSLKMFDPAKDAGSKSVVIANPPFGAERDQPSYPNVWEDYSKESETTILFVKLMFELLRKNGRCAVVVSEGLLTWGQNSACALRKLLLNEANLKAIISIPQGVFVSKGGQGAKTTILYFEKGTPSNFIWHYKIENDGFSIGTNRKSIEGSQIPELLELFKDVKQGIKPKNTVHSFCIPKEWIETIDPRISDRIKKETLEKLIERNKPKREKLLDELNKKLSKEKISQDDYEEKIRLFDSILKNQIENEITKAIEKAYTYHLNLQNYRSSLSQEQIQEWQNVLQNIKPINNSSLEKRYKSLQSACPDKAVQIIASFEPQNALHMDIVREYLANLKDKNEVFSKIEEIIKQVRKYPAVSLKDYLILNEDKITPSDYSDIEFTVLGVSNQIGVFINEKKKGQEIKQKYFKVSKNQFCYNPYRINVGSIGFNDFDFENQIISGAYVVFCCNENELSSKFLDALVKSAKFIEYVNSKANGGVRMDFKFEYLQTWEIPLPPFEIQNEIVDQIERQKQIIYGAEKIIESFELQIPSYCKDEFQNIQTNSIILDMQNGLYKSESFYGSGFPIIRINDYKNGDIIYDTKKLERLELEEKEFEKYLLFDDCLIINRVNSLEHVGKVALIKITNENTVYESNMIRIRLNKELINPIYALYILSSLSVKKQLQILSKRAINQVSINQEDIKKTIIPLPSLEIQQKIVEHLDREIQAFEAVRYLKQEAEKRIGEILNRLWVENNDHEVSHE